ncbi:tryptophan synthase, alpha chain [Marininema mesophilum]|uniref:Tryptophan synthase alpha chain n=1 Tax=Marininema mesophilum TaxID=1048340 RepID=A0A1H2UUP6_9BACL|nr:tryptophan synthase subunit alpha [Marininema mesophilum]SDW59304.1 tryptophan synthase, alpha chain [Marininema mesophilum]
MNRIEAAFQQPGRKLIPYLTAGDPDRKASLEIIRMLDEEGACAIELGVPYSDPLADGPVIQEASGRALQNGMTLTGVLELARESRKVGVKAPLILFSYVNPLLRFGFRRLVLEAKACGIDGMIVPDLPYEESGELSDLAKKEGLCLIPLVAPTSKERVHRIVKEAQGFVYCVSSLGTTGTRASFSNKVEEFLDTVKEASQVPTAVGFGISEREHVDRFLNHVDAAVVGSALVRRIGEHATQLTDDRSRGLALEEIRHFFRELAEEEGAALRGNIK